MTKLCDCWRQIEPDPYDSKTDGVCDGTREREYCKCHGDISQCEFYPEKRSATMDTLDMMKQAKIDGKTYQHDDETFYNVCSGFMDETGGALPMGDIYASTLDEIFDWAWTPVRNAITRAEAEERLGVKIVG